MEPSNIWPDRLSEEDCEAMICRLNQRYQRWDDPCISAYELAAWAHVKPHAAADLLCEFASHGLLVLSCLDQYGFMVFRVERGFRITGPITAVEPRALP